MNASPHLTVLTATDVVTLTTVPIAQLSPTANLTVFVNMSEPNASPNVLSKLQTSTAVLLALTASGQTQ
jgi:hypothetical protein